MSASEKFQFTIPAYLEKAENDEWRIWGLASNNRRDQQGEIIDVSGLDLSPIEKGRGVFNNDHKKGFENTLGIIDKYKKTDNELYLGGYLFKEHDKAKAVYQIMKSLKKSDRSRVGMSIEGVIKGREGPDGKKIAKAVVTACALTLSPVNSDTFVDLSKSAPLLKSMAALEFNSTDLTDGVQVAEAETPAPTFTSDQVVALLSKALSVGTAYATSTPAQLTGGDALAQEDLEHKKKRKAKKSEGDLPATMFKSVLMEILDQLQKLHPEHSRSDLWNACKARLNQRLDEGEKIIAA